MIPLYQDDVYEYPLQKTVPDKLLTNS